MGAAQKELVRQFDHKILEFSTQSETKDAAVQALKKKEKQLLETTAELSYAKSALKSGEVQDILMKLPGLLMETSDKTLIKEEATLIGEYSKISARKHEISRRDNSSSISRMEARH